MSNISNMNELKINGRILSIKRVDNKTIDIITASLMIPKKDKKTGKSVNKFFNLKAFGTTAIELLRVEPKSKILLDGYLDQEIYMNKEGKEIRKDCIVIKSFIVEEVATPFTASKEAVEDVKAYDLGKQLDDDPFGIPF